MSIEDALKRIYHRDFEERIDRTKFLTPHYRRFIGSHYFSSNSTDCLYLFRDGYYFGTTMCAQSLVEALIRFIAKRNKRNWKGEFELILDDLKIQKIVTEAFVETSLKIWRHRNDFHHLNQNISKIDMKTKAEESIIGICRLEEEIFGGDIHDDNFYPKQPKYYEISPNGTAPFELRQLDV